MNDQKKSISPGQVYDGRKVLGFRKSEKCVKCGGSAYSRHYHGMASITHTGDCGTDLTKITCRDCGYFWWEVCADYKSPKPLFVALTLTPLWPNDLTPEQRARLEVEEIAPETP